MRWKLILPTAAVLTCLCGTQAFGQTVGAYCRPTRHVIERSEFVGREPVRYAPYVVYRPVQDRPYYAEPHRHHRSWARTALVIGGSAATGAGIGGIVHGTRGALIGGAIGGGLASIVEGQRHRRDWR
jgi:hypothetical protein